MKVYLITTGVVFALITLAHIVRAIAEGPLLAKDPVFIMLTLLAAGLSVWAWRLLRRSPPPHPPITTSEA
jgi:hypothetical protein